MPVCLGYSDTAYHRLPSVIAHRGASGEAPENTLPAFERAAMQGAHWLEVDVCLSADGQPVIFHDEKLNRCTNGRGWLIQHTLAELQQLDAGLWFAESFRGTRIATLAELLDFARQHDMGLNLEIKPVIGREAETVWAMRQELLNHPMHQPVLLSSFNTTALRCARTHMPHLTRALLTEAIPRDWQQRLQELECSGLHVCAELIEPALLEQVIHAGYRALAWTVNDPEQAERLYSLGVNAVFTDFPARLLKSAAISQQSH
jgi:glycerophosphoryl diester phosphodiesterase